MRLTGEQKSRIYGLYAEGLTDSADICMLMMGEVSMSQITELLTDFCEMLSRQDAQEQTHLALPWSFVPPVSGHIARDSRTGRMPGCDGQNGGDPSGMGDHDMYGADTD